MRWFVGALSDDQSDEEHGCGGEEGHSGDMDEGVGSDGFAEDVSEDAGADESGDAAQAVDGALQLALFGGTGFVRKDALR